jgi:type I restriction enzyme S subunit
MAGEAPIEHDPRWPVVSLAEIATKIGSGATPRGGADAYLPTRERYALVRSQNVFDRRFDHAGLAFITDEQAEGLRGVALQPADILLNITGDGITFGRACMVPKDVLPACVNQHVSIVRVDAQRADAGYVLAFLTHPDVKPYIESFNAGGSRRAVTKGHIESFRLPLPPLPEQRAIAHILGTLDDKIELNRRMSETLEAMARALFKSWFVDFDPVRAKAEGRDPNLAKPLADLFPTRLVDSELGEIPQGWGVGPLDSVLVLQRGFDLPATERTSGMYPVLAASGPSGTHNEFMVRGPGVTTGRSGVLGKVFYVAEDFWPLNTSLWVKEFRHSKPAYAFHLLQGQDFALFNAGSAVPTLNRNHVHTLPTLLPPMPLIEEFERAAFASLERQRLGDQQSATLAALRDTLLPKLISGELRLKNVEESIEEAT